MKYLVDKQKRVTKKRVMGIEPTYPAWKAGVLPLNYTRTFKVPRTGIEPVTRGFSVLCSTNWAIWAFITSAIANVSCGGRIWTYDLRVMSPTSFQTAPSRDILFLYLISQVKPMIGLEPITCWLQISCSANWATSADCLIGKWVVVDSNHRSNLQQIYSLSPLATRESTHLLN